MHSQLVEIRTGGDQTVTDLTHEAERFLSGATNSSTASAPDSPVGSSAGSTAASSARDGLLHVFVPHATAGIAIVETGAGSDDDLLDVLEELLPPGRDWTHRHGTPGHGRDHVVPAFVAPYATLPVLDGRLELGTWQRICLVDTNRDNRVRKVRFSFLSG